MIISILGSGSSGNSTIITSGNTSILIDAGFSAKALTNRLNQINLKINQLDAIIISHEHNDHCKGWKSCAEYFDTTIYATESTQQLINVNGKNINTVAFHTGKSFKIGNLTIHPFPIPHDSCDPTGFIIQDNNHKVGVATDLGFITNLAKNYLSQCDIVIIESNHDVDMLMNGPYPWYLKQRIMSRLGHLSNDNVASFIKECINEKCLFLLLAHLSKQNNRNELVLSTALSALGNNKITKVIISQQEIPTDIIEL
jgi:phosphoribosyl 1,2-cyclic phosphodiesterase